MTADELCQLSQSGAYCYRSNDETWAPPLIELATYEGLIKWRLDYKRRWVGRLENVEMPRTYMIENGWLWQWYDDSGSLREFWAKRHELKRSGTSIDLSSLYVAIASMQ